MKNRILSLVLAAIMVLTMSVAVSALDVPTPGGDSIFNADRMMKFDDGTKFHNGIVNGGIINPGTGAVSTYAGVKFDIDTYKGEKCVKVELLEEKVTGYFDFNYYQWNAEYYNPSLDTADYSWFRVRYAYNDAAADIDCLKFWASPDSPVLGITTPAAFKIWDIANGNGDWVDTVINVDDLIFEDGTAWGETTIRQFRLHMFEYNENPEAVCYIAGFGFFATEEEAKSYNFATGEFEGGVTPAATEQATEVATTEKATEVATTEKATEVATTEKATEVATTEKATEVATTEKATEVATTEKATEVVADATEEATEADETTEEATEADETTEEVTEVAVATEEKTEEKTEKATEEKTEEKTETPAVEEPAEEGGNTGIIVGVVAAVVVVIALVAFLVSKKKK